MASSGSDELAQTAGADAVEVPASTDVAEPVAAEPVAAEPSSTTTKSTSRPKAKPKRKSTAKDTPTKAGGDALPSLPVPLKLPTFEEALVPKSTIRNLARPVLPADGSGSITKDAMTALTKGTSVFVSYLSALANEHCVAKKRKTVLPQDVWDALEDADLGQFVDELKHAHDAAEAAKSKKREAAKRRSGANAAADTTVEADDEIEDDDDDEEEEVGDADVTANSLGPSRKKARTSAVTNGDGDEDEDEDGEAAAGADGNATEDEADEGDAISSDEEDDNDAQLVSAEADVDDEDDDADRPGPTSRRDEAVDDDEDSD